MQGGNDLYCYLFYGHYVIKMGPCSLLNYNGRNRKMIVLKCTEKITMKKKPSLKTKLSE